MKKATKNYFLLSCMAISSFNYSDAQSQTVKRVDPGKAGMHASLVEYNLGSAPKFEKGKIPVIADNGNIENIENMILLNVQKDELGFEHYRYQQTYKGIPIENAIIVVHVKDGKVLFENGKLIKTFPEKLSAQPLVNSQMAIKSALNNIKAKSYAWENQLREAQLKKDKKDVKATYYPKGDLVWYSTDGAIDPLKLKLAYKLDILATDPNTHQLVYIDANSGVVLCKNGADKFDLGTSGTAHTVYNGVQPIISDSKGLDLVDHKLIDNILLDIGRGKGIHTLKGNKIDAGYYYGQTPPTITQILDKATEYTNEDFNNDWNIINNDLDQYATDAHWGAEKTLDYYKTKFNAENIGSDNNPLRLFVNVDLPKLDATYGNSVNATWYPGINAVIFGKGGKNSKGVEYKPVVSLDVVGHELTHSLTGNTSNLGIKNEAGALNEGFSDIFGTCIEFFVRNGNGNWLYGEDCGPAFRRLDQPELLQTPSSYKGNFWYAMTDPLNNIEQSRFVHFNSTVLSHWFYLLTVGGSGVNDNGCSYDVKGIGIEKAERIAFYTNAYFLTNTSDFAETQKISSFVAQLLYGYGSNEMIQTINAWQAVGLSAPNYFPDADNYCPGVFIKVNYCGFGVNPGNLYILQISDANGSFAQATNLSTLKSDAGTGCWRTPGAD